MSGKRLHRLGLQAGGWILGACLWVLMFHLTTAEAGTLGWSKPITDIFQEIRFIGFICVGGAATLAGIEVLFHRSLDRLGSIISSLGVGTGLIVGGIAAAVVLTGAVAAPLTAAPYVVGRAEAWGDVLSQMVYYGTFVWTGASLWLEARRYGR